MAARRWIGALAAMLTAASAAAAGPLQSQVATATLQLPHALEGGSASWCTWGQCYLGPRLYLAPRAGGSLLVGWTDSSGDGHVSVVAGEQITTTHDFPDHKLRGLVAHGDGTYAVLLKEGVDLCLSKRAANGSAVWTTYLNSTTAEDSSPLGDHRLAYGGGRYAAYWAVHSFSGHEGDQLRYVNDAGAIVSGGWTWGCSHSMAELVGYHPQDLTFTNFCSTDCYPSPPGLKMNYSTTIFTGDGNCSGGVSLQLGQMAAAETGWKVVFSAVDTDDEPAYGIGLATAGGSAARTVVWLTDTDGSQERDPVIARIGTQLPERYLVGWRTISDGAFHLGVVSGSGTFLEGPEQLGAPAPGWGMRDDSFRSLADGSVAWLEGSSGSSTLKLHRYGSTMVFGDGFESGT
ncbi:MAG TPA: hypothetical protein VLT81_11860, partial [Chondromyces sp.]|nr:hypothetical protein [Chondromyces sp.]